MKRLLPLLALCPAVLFANSHDQKLIGLSRAVGLAETALSARAIEGELEADDQRLVYEIDLVRGTTLHRAVVDAHSGRLLSVDRPRIENLVRSWIDSDRLRQGGRAPALTDRLRSLEQRTHGEAKSVSFRLRDGRGVYEVELATMAGVGKVHIDAATGQRVALAIED